MGVRDLQGSVVFCLFFLVLPSFPGKGMVFGDRCERPIIGLCSFSYQPMYCISVFRIMMMIFGGCERPCLYTCYLFHIYLCYPSIKSFLLA